ncbi:hypothetical protein RINTHH_11460 [Richelia intracellularis HH01]|jgi:hypothetical protein|uniref:Uncharacterized protein n=1 Tax=Richelia intracellularis HH01 TaxID=1165094 RepID=M1X5F9_9NOST|nr:HpsJ family protein [Richelia intracellularis]CCH67301.1 hypothetical protein RINTHH_11460 [Richelia intracellularis HH01]
MINNLSTAITSRTLKIIAVILILSFLLDVLVLIFPFQVTDSKWQISLVTALVDRGIIPMVGLGMLFIGYWIDNKNESHRFSLHLKIPASIFAVILGMMFLAFFPLHVNNMNQFSKQKLKEINQEADRAEKQLETSLFQTKAQFNSEQGKAQLKQLRDRTKTQLTEIIEDETKYKQVLANNQIPDLVKDVLKKAKVNPKELDKLVSQQTNPLSAAQQSANEQLTKIRVRRKRLEKNTKQEAWKSFISIGLNSLLLSVGYTIIGWSSLREMHNYSDKKHKNAIH